MQLFKNSGIVDISDKQRFTEFDLQVIKDNLNSNKRDFESELLAQDMHRFLQKDKSLRTELLKARGLLNEDRITMNENCLYDSEL